MNKRKILLVEDKEDMVYALKMQLEGRDFAVEVAEDGKTALDKVRDVNPDLIILDIMLPKIDGYKVCQMIKADESYQHIPVVMLTCRVQEEDQRLGYEVGADAYVTKPFELDQLIEQINDLLK